jgi:hypothetical protein
MSQALSHQTDPLATSCPHLGQLSADRRREPPMEYPSFENQCLALGAGELILLGDQATYCFASNHRNCPRFRRATVKSGDPISDFVPFHTLAEDAWPALNAASPLTEGDLLFESLLDPSDEGEERTNRRRWAWIGASLVFASVFLCGSMIASYTGWQWIERNLPGRAAGSGNVDTVAAANQAPTPAVFVVYTATPEPGQADAPRVVGPTAPMIVLQPGAGLPGVGFPEAVTPTPIVIEPSLPLAEAATGEGAASVPAETEPLINIDIPIPTRRPTPIFDLPTSTPFAEAAPPATLTPTPAPLGTPIVIFAAEQGALQKGLCTFVRWTVYNVREVYYEDLPANGEGEREVCIDEEDRIFELRVIFGDGTSQVYTTTVAFLEPTPTITPTPSFTPVPEYTPTWTPPPPTATPTPNVRYGVVLAPAAGTELVCDGSQPCEIGLLATNSGDGTDTLVVSLLQNGAFSTQLCRPDGVCAGNDLRIAGVGPGNTAYISMRVVIPDGAGAQSTTYTLLVSSEGSGRSIVSQPLTISVTVP